MLNVRNYRAERRKGFSLAELLVVILVIVIVAGTLAPALAKGRAKREAMQCLTNHRQMALAWSLYSADYNGWLLASLTGTGVDTHRVLWCSGNLDYTSAKSNWDPNISIVTSPLFRYSGKNPAIWHCPADLTRVRDSKGVFVQRVRSISMSQVFDFGLWLPGTLSGGPWRCYQRMSEIVNPGKTWVFIDEHPDSINDGAFALQMPGGTVDAVSQARVGQWVDCPASYHEGGCVLSFGDGHGELKRWRGDTTSTRKPMGRLGGANLLLATVQNRGIFDLIWLAQRTTADREGKTP